jgi:hypothetical protein
VGSREALLALSRLAFLVEVDGLGLPRRQSLGLALADHRQGLGDKTRPIRRFRGESCNFRSTSSAGVQEGSRDVERRVAHSQPPPLQTFVVALGR